MPFVGLGLHVLVALFFAVHAMRSGQQMYWLIILFSFPLLGSIVYFLVIYLPDSRLERGARRAVAAAAKSLDPTRELREARTEFEYTPTAQNQMRLALALLEAGNAEEAATNYEACLKGPFAADQQIRFLAARAFVESGRYARAVGHLEEIRAADANFRAEQVSLLIARALAGAGRNQEAKLEFEAALGRYGSFESLVEFTIWALAARDDATAARLQAEIGKIMTRWNRHTRELNKHILQRLDAARTVAAQRA
jgi:hypothetical protein